MIGVTSRQAGRQARLEGEDHFRRARLRNAQGRLPRLRDHAGVTRKCDGVAGRCMCRGAIRTARHALSAGIHSGPVVWVGEFTHPAKQKTIRSIHAVDDFAKNWLFKQIGVTLI